MATNSVIQRSFAGGELAPIHHARADLAKYLQGGRTVENFLVRKEGGLANRAGFRYVDNTNDDDPIILRRYEHETPGESILVEMGEGYFRFFKNGAAVEVTGVAAWSAVTNYVPGDIVVDGGVNYYCILASLNNDPPNATYWYPMPSDGRLEIPH